METYDEVRAQELERHEQAQASIVALLEHSSRVSGKKLYLTLETPHHTADMMDPFTFLQLSTLRVDIHRIGCP